MAKATKKTLTFADYTGLAAAELFKVVADYAVKPVELLSKAKEKITGSYHDAAISVAALKRLYTSRIEARDIPGDTAFKKYFKDNVGGELPGRVEAGASLFNSLVLTLDARGNSMITEEIFRDAAPDWLEKASAIVNAAQKQHGENWKTCDEVLDMILALSKPGDAAKKLKDIRKRQKGESTGEGEGEGAGANGAKSAVAITPQLAAEYLIAAIKGAGKLSNDEGKALFIATQEIVIAWDASGVTNETQDQWHREYTDATEAGIAPHIEIVRAAELQAA